jgi:hypothetical protein
MVHILPVAPLGTTDQMSPDHSAVPIEALGDSSGDVVDGFAAKGSGHQACGLRERVGCGAGLGGDTDLDDVTGSARLASVAPTSSNSASTAVPAAEGSRAGSRRA